MRIEPGNLMPNFKEAKSLSSLQGNLMPNFSMKKASQSIKMLRPRTEKQVDFFLPFGFIIKKSVLALAFPVTNKAKHE